jgi:hypothetical protein
MRMLGNFNIYQYYVKFTYKPINQLLWVDNFKVDETWQFVNIKNGGRNITRGYMNKSPQLQTSSLPVSIYSCNRFYHFDCEKGVGYAIISNPSIPDIPGLNIIETEARPYTTVYEAKIDFHIMLTAINIMDEDAIIEAKNPSLTEATIYHQELYIKIYANIISYTGEEESNHKIFKEFCSKICDIYEAEYPRLQKLFDNPAIDKAETDPSDAHFAIAYHTWFRAARENQRNWPAISRNPLSDKSIEFPSGSRHWYSPPKESSQFVGLALRHDDHPEKLIPKLYQTDQRLIESSQLYYYLRHGTPQPDKKISIPVPVRESFVFSLSYTKKCGPTTIKEYVDEPRIDLNYDGSIRVCDMEPKVITFNNWIIGKVNIKSYNYSGLSPNNEDCHKNELKMPYIKPKAQLLGSDNNRTKILYNDTPCSSHATACPAGCQKQHEHVAAPNKDLTCALHKQLSCSFCQAERADCASCAKHNEWLKSTGPRIGSIITIPWYYQQIVHDYNKLKRLRDGPIMDLMHIGIVNPDGDDIITFPCGNIEDLYVGITLETHRLSTFKAQALIYDKNRCK